ncbi:hypothetical protein [Staphylococcus aureus]|nr:hypothetical protein [Staphylococcus aureus]AWQ97482.1 hypothetical protein CSC54_2659 [Staphylococcus aureus]AWR13844.1 hypothetical protein CSB71_1919 [Staphylococcus aureus]MCQ6819177.1 hypothetical protein [Staphylococcus aureus]MCQ6821714.1 hypothetical protein [Staphylococcus aureus]MCQ6832619.1 hypothetical protein [Staphylococcus aureus]
MLHFLLPAVLRILKKNIKKSKIDRVNEKINEIDDIDMIKKGG